MLFQTMMEYFSCFARKRSNHEAIMDVYLRDWYATSPYLYHIGMPKKIVHCSNCKVVGMYIIGFKINFKKLKMYQIQSNL